MEIQMIIPILYFIFIIINLIFINNIKYIRVLLLFLILLIIIIFSFGPFVSDVNIYSNWYNEIRTLKLSSTNTSSYLFFKNMEFFRLLGFSFNGYRFFSIIVVLFIFAFICKKVEADFRVFLFLYLLFPFFLDYVQLRFFFSEVAILLAIYYLANDNKILFLFLIGIASLFHSMNFIFIVLFFINMKKFNAKKRVLLAFISIPVFVIIFLLKNYFFTTFSLKNIFWIKEYSNYFYRQNMKWGFFIYVLDSLANLFIANINYKFLKVINTKVTINFCKIVLIINYLNLYILPFIQININFNRYIRFAFVCNLICTAIVFHKTFIQKAKIFYGYRLSVKFKLINNFEVSYWLVFGIGFAINLLNELLFNYSLKLIFCSVLNI